MIAEDVLERALGATAAGYDVPPGATDRLRDLLAPAAATPRETRRQRIAAWRPAPRTGLAGGAAAAVVLIGVAFALGGPGGSGAPSARLAPAVGGAVGSTGGSAPTPAGANGLGGPEFGAAQGSVTTGGPATAARGRQSQKSAVDAVPVGGDSARVVKTGELDLQVSKNQVGRTLTRLTALVPANGYVADSSTSEGGGTPSGQVTLRVPVDQFEVTVAKARALGKVLSLQTSGKDVTAQYVDLKARIRALTATRENFLTLLTKATTIGDTLAVQQQITDVQTQIDQLQGQLNLLADQSDMATLTVTVNQALPPVPLVAHHKSGLAKAVDTSVGRFVRGVEVLIGLVGPVLFALLLVVAGWLAVRFGYRVLRRRLV